MTTNCKVIFITAVTWIPILPFLYLPNTFWTVALKIISGIFLVSLIYNLTLGLGSNVYGPAYAGFILNAIWFTIINLYPPKWIAFILYLLIFTGLGTCHAILNKMAHDEMYPAESPILWAIFPWAIYPWGFVKKILNKNYKKEITNYTSFLKQHEDDNISTWLAEAILFRVDLENEGTLPTTKLEDGSICPDLIDLVPLWTGLSACLNLLSKKSNEATSHMILSLWYYTVLSLIKPDLLSEGKNMWNELNRGLKNANSELKRIINERYCNDPSRMRAFEILSNLPPKQLL